MRPETIVRRKLADLFGRFAEDLIPSLVVEQQAIIKLTPARIFEASEWNKITEIVEAKEGCWEHNEKVWKLPRFRSRMNLPASSEKPRLHVRPTTLQNLLFLHEAFRGKPPGSWRDIQEALQSFRPKKSKRRNKYSKATCRDYLGALLALETR